MVYLIATAGLYVLMETLAWLFSDRLIFQRGPASYRDSDEIIKLKTGDGETISAVHLPNSDATHTILFSHGSAEDIGDMMPLLLEMQRNGFSVFAYDYPGYGTSTGRPSSANAVRAAQTAYDYLTRELRIASDGIIAHGRSLGGAVAVELASREPIAGLIIESSFVTAVRVATRVSLPPFDKFRSIRKIARVGCPVLVIHGTADKLIPIWHGRKLHACADEPKRALWVDGAGHNDVRFIAGERYWGALREFSETVASAGK